MEVSMIDILKLLSEFDAKKVDEDKNGFSRSIEFTTKLGKTYKIVWWSNVAYMYFDEGSFVRFYNLILSDTWPNKYELGLHLEYRDETVCYIPMTEREEKT